MTTIYEYPFHCATSFAKTTWAIPYLGKIMVFVAMATMLLATVQIDCTPEWNSVQCLSWDHRLIS